jgi:hypothetical protein
MAHSHHHHHDQSAYYTEQLCTIGICGAMGAIAITLYATGGLKVLLKEGILTDSVLAGGIALLALTLVRAVALWFSVGKPEANCDHSHEPDCCGHDHEHGVAVAESHEHAHHHNHEHDHGHAHGHGHGHDHSHGGHSHEHDHGWAPVRYIVLLIPILLYFFVPLEALSLGQAHNVKIDYDVAYKDSKGFIGELGFGELTGAASEEGRRQFYEGKVATIRGQFAPMDSPQRFSLVRYKIRCCAADAVPLQAVVLVDDSQVQDLEAEKRLPDASHLNRKWVEVTCQIQFRKRLDQPNEWITVLLVRPTKEKPLSELVKPTTPDPNPYL